MIFLKIIIAWTVLSIAIGVGFGPLMRWCLHYEPPQLPPLPSGSIDRDGLTS
jgi:hypothetical protein